MSKSSSDYNLTIMMCARVDHATSSLHCHICSSERPLVCSIVVAHRTERWAAEVAQISASGFPECLPHGFNINLVASGQRRALARKRTDGASWRAIGGCLCTLDGRCHARRRRCPRSGGGSRRSKRRGRSSRDQGWMSRDMGRIATCVSELLLAVNHIRKRNKAQAADISRFQRAIIRSGFRISVCKRRERGSQVVVHG
jgi:hypothetical protein